MANRSAEIVSKIILFYISGRYSQKTQGEFNAWFSSDIHREEKEAALKDLWDETVTVDRERDHDTETDMAFRRLTSRLGICGETGTLIKPEMSYTRRAKRVRLGNRVGKIAAAMTILFIMGGTAYFIWQKMVAAVEETRTASVTASPRTISVAADDVPREVVFADGSVVWLNSYSVMEHKEDFATNRVVALTGEAYFDIAADTANPFVVHTSNLKVTVTGTRFNISDYPEQVTATLSLYQGEVTVQSADGTRHLSAGRKLIYDQPATKTEIRPEESVKPLWMISPAEFRYAPLSGILARVGEMYGVTVGFLPVGVPDDTMTLILDGTETLEETLFRLKSLSGKFNFTIEGTRVKIEKN